MSDSKPRRLEPKSIPVVGWSRALATFRREVATHAPSGLNVLLMGEVGTGKKTMARVWQAVAESAGVRMAIEDLDAESPSVADQCIGYSTKRLPNELSCLHLGTAENQGFPAASTDQESLPLAIASQFSLRLYVPPLRERRADIDALLHFFNRYVLPSRLRCAYEAISKKLLAKMSIKYWPMNARDLLNCLVYSASHDSSKVETPASSGVVKLGVLETTSGLGSNTYMADREDEMFVRSHLLEQVRASLNSACGGRSVLAAMIDAAPECVSFHQLDSAGAEVGGPNQVRADWTISSEEPVIPFENLPQCMIEDFWDEVFPREHVGPYRPPAPATLQNLTLEQAMGVDGIDEIKEKMRTDPDCIRMIEEFESALAVMRASAETNLIFGTTYSALQEGQGVDLEEAWSIASGTAVKRRRRPPADKVEELVAKYLAEHPGATVRKVAEDVRVSTGTVSESQAWQAELLTRARVGLSS